MFNTLINMGMDKSIYLLIVSIRLIEQRNTKFPLLLFLCTEQYLQKPVYISAGQQLTSSEHAKCT